MGSSLWGKKVDKTLFGGQKYNLRENRERPGENVIFFVKDENVEKKEKKMSRKQCRV